MYPTRMHFIKYKTGYLGKNNSVFGFVKESHASQVIDRLKYLSPIITISPSTYVLNRKPHRIHQHNKLQQPPLNKKHLQVKTFETSVGSFFASINNMDLKLIDEVLVDKLSDTIILKSEFALDEMVPLEYDDHVNHLNKLYSKSDTDNIDYLDEMSKIIVERYIVDSDFDDDVFDYE